MTELLDNGGVRRFCLGMVKLAIIDSANGDDLALVWLRQSAMAQEMLELCGLRKNRIDTAIENYKKLRSKNGRLRKQQTTEYP